jgi:hypothetical protein
MKKLWLIPVLVMMCGPQVQALVCQATPEGMYAYQDQILALAGKNPDTKAFKKAVAEPLLCLLQNYKNETGFTRYVAGTCLRRLWGGAEIQGFHRGKNYELALQQLIGHQINRQDLLKNSELSVYAMLQWEEYQPFCKGVTAESECVELLPDSAKIREQSELLGSTSMMTLLSAYKQFSGSTKQRVADLITKLYREIPKDQPLKRKVIEQIYREMQPKIELRQS